MLCVPIFDLILPVLQLAGVRVELNQLREELDECIRGQDFERAAEIKVKVAELDATKNSLLDDAQPKSQEVRTEKVSMLACKLCV